MDNISKGICPECGYTFNMSTNLKDEKAKPKPGDVGFCVKCAAIFEFDGTGVISCDIDKLEPKKRAEIEKIKAAWFRMKRHYDKFPRYCS